jgi:hypothetical protein
LLHRFEASERSSGFATTLTCCLFYLHSNKFRNLTKEKFKYVIHQIISLLLVPYIIHVIIFHLEVNRYVYMVVCGTSGKHTCSCIILYCTSFMDVAAYLPRPYHYSIVRCPRRGTMQLHTLLGMEAVDMAFALHLHSFQICIGMNVVMRT